jgi:predicted DNA-binding transcriptional regulator YafY
MRTLRLFTLLDLLRAKRVPVSAETLAEELEVTSRTIYRDMATLQTIGAPVRGESGMGYQLERGFFLPPLHFDSEELEAVALGLRLVSARADPSLEQATERAAAKIASVLPDDRRRLYEALPFMAPRNPSERLALAAQHLPSLRNAIRERWKVELVYRDESGTKTERTAWPLGLTVFDEIWLLGVWCELRNDFRSLRVDRLESVKIGDAKFAPLRGRRFEDFLLRFTQGSPDAEPVEATARPSSHRNGSEIPAVAKTFSLCKVGEDGRDFIRKWK